MKSISIYQLFTRAVAIAIMTVFSVAASAADERSSTVRQTELKTAPVNGKVIVSLPANTEVVVTARESGWARVEANGRQGWLPSTHLKQTVTVIEQAAPSSGGFLSWFSAVLRTDRGPTVTSARRAQTATIGIRGMDDGSVQVSKFNSEELQKLKLYSVSRSDAEEFARNAQLSAQQIAYLDGQSR